MFKVNNRNSKTRCAVEAGNRHQNYVINALVSLLLTFSKFNPSSNDSIIAFERVIVTDS